MAIAPNGETAYMLDYTDPVYPISGTTVGTSIEVNHHATALVVTPTGAPTANENTFVYVADQDADRGGTVSYFDITDPLHVDGAISLPGSYANLQAMAITPNGTTAYVVDSNNNWVIPIDIRTNSILPETTPIPVGDDPSAIAISPDGALAYVLGLNDTGKLSVVQIDLATNIPLPTPIVVDGEDDVWPEGIAITPDGKSLYVVGYDITGGETGKVYIVDVTSHDVTSIAFPGSFLVGIAITPDQAPTANFTATSAGATVECNASRSHSPVGDIATYSWDFGDGSAVVTTQAPIITHTYNAARTFTVGLTVTNSAGTSTAQTFTGQTVSNNGLSSATTAKQISIGSTILPPRHFKGKIHSGKHKHRYLLNTIWHKSRSKKIKRYEIFDHHKRLMSIKRGEKMMARLHFYAPFAHKRDFSKRFIHKLHERYTIRAVDSKGHKSNFCHLDIMIPKN
jgi:DNA-binding beta-propeller fold protein YncE